MNDTIEITQIVERLYEHFDREQLHIIYHTYETLGVDIDKGLRALYEQSQLEIFLEENLV